MEEETCQILGEEGTKTDEISLEDEPDKVLAPEFSPILQHIHNLLLNTYDRDIQIINNQRSQSMFIFTIIGLIIPLAVEIGNGILDYFKQILTPFPEYFVPIAWVARIILLCLLGSPLILTAHRSYSAYAKSLECCWHEYPTTHILKQCKDQSSNLSLDLRSECFILSNLIDSNRNTKKELRTYLEKSYYWIKISVYVIIIISLLLLNIPILLEILLL